MQKEALFSTMIEFLVTIAIVGVIFLIGMLGYNRFSRSQVLTQAALELRQDLAFTQDKALAAERPFGWCDEKDEGLEGYGLFFSNNGDSYAVKPVCSTGADGDSIKDIVLPSSVSGPRNAGVLFKSFDSETATEASFVLTLTGARSEAIWVSREGEIE